MSKDLIHRLSAFIACVLVLAQPVLAAEGVGRPLVSVQWLTQNLNREDVLVIDASPAKLHAAGHIPGAVNVPLGDLRTACESWDRSGAIRLYCAVGFRSYLAYRILV